MIKIIDLFIIYTDIFFRIYECPIVDFIFTIFVFRHIKLTRHLNGGLKYYNLAINH
ncbi:hypothetical protein BANRA_01230 [Escherichia coli]|uniref:Uncharacterized protein n=1 Tax=Escherichia coli TaxID=562 RepID=A0A3P5DN61_ECOLX|nr:hypothetical protein BANRA_01230 [Escherichia coli]